MYDPGRAASGSLTYEPFFGLREKAFSLSSDPRFLFKSPAHAPAFDALLAGIRRREGLIVLTGEIGTGKTTLCRSVLRHLDRRTFAAFVPDPFVSREDLLRTLLVDFGVVSIGDLTRGPFSGASRSDLSFLLYEFLDSLAPLQAFAVLVIDEAQNLPLPLLEEIRILSELERREKLLQVVLVGQPELRDSLRLPQMRQVEQRVSVRCDLGPLDAEAVAGYVRHRLLVAGSGEPRVQFTPPALEALWRGSGGVPRMINRLCDRALDRAHTARSLLIDAQLVDQAIDDLGCARTTREETVEETPAPPAELRFVPMEPPAAPVTIVAVQGDDGTSLLEFASETDRSVEPSTSVVPFASYTKRVAAAAASSLAVVALMGAPAWYLRTQTGNVREVMAALPPAPQPRALANGGAELPRDAALVLAALINADAAASAAVTAENELYTIVVASFASRSRAERSIEELTSAGFQGRVIERDWGPPRGRMYQINVGGYASPNDADPDLQKIRELSGGYRDARIVEQR